MAVNSTPIQPSQWKALDSENRSQPDQHVHSAHDYNYVILSINHLLELTRLYHLFFLNNLSAQVGLVDWALKKTMGRFVDLISSQIAHCPECIFVWCVIRVRIMWMRGVPRSMASTMVAPRQTTGHTIRVDHFPHPGTQESLECTRKGLPLHFLEGLKVWPWLLIPVCLQVPLVRQNNLHSPAWQRIRNKEPESDYLRYVQVQKRWQCQILALFTSTGNA